MRYIVSQYIKCDGAEIHHTVVDRLDDINEAFKNLAITYINKRYCYEGKCKAEYEVIEK